MLNSEQLRSFAEEGYLVVENVVDRDTVLEPVIAEYQTIMDRLWAGWAAGGQAGAPGKGASFEDSIIAAYRAGMEYFQPMDISLPPGDITPDTSFHAGPAVFSMLTNELLLDAVEAIIGPEITSNPIQHVRIKPPATDLTEDEIRAHITSTAWHQDLAVTLEEADRTRMVTVWLAVTDATAENGCLQVIPKSHRGEMLPHCPLPQVGVPAEFFDEQAAIPLPVPSGGAIFFHPLTIHGSRVNHTDGIRWSFDVRYNVTGDPTGRPMFPDFVARSRTHPETVLRDANRWLAMWEDTRLRLSSGEPVQVHRWSPDAAHCA